PTYFFFYSHRHHRDLHSFPTRRSSDLGQLSGGGLQVADDLGVEEVRDGRGLLLVRVDRQFSVHRADRRLGQHRDGQGELLELLADRKSTRLNSSHLGISYAVFCLKKKN